MRNFLRNYLERDFSLDKASLNRYIIFNFQRSKNNERRSQMNLYDQLFKEYFSIKEIFANIFNVFCFDGKIHLNPNKLENLEIWNRPWLYLYPEYDFAETYAAAFQNAVLMSDDQAFYLLIVIGSQDRYFYPTPLAVASFETYYYSYQLNIGASRIEKPFFPLAIYLGTDDWTAPIAFRNLTVLLN